MSTAGYSAPLERLERPAWEPDPRLAKGSRTELDAFPLRFSDVEDWPTHDDRPHELDGLWEEHVDEDDERYGTQVGLKFGGWPLCVQSEVDWHEGGRRLAGVEFVFQVDSDAKVGFNVGYGGVVYVGHRAGEGTWHLTTQSM